MGRDAIALAEAGELEAGHRHDPEGHVWGFASWEPARTDLQSGGFYLMSAARPVEICPCGALKYGVIEELVSVQTEQAFAPVIDHEVGS